MHRILPLLLALLLAPAAARAYSQAEETAYRSVFSAAALGVERPSPGLVTTWTLGYRGFVPHAAFAFTRDPDTGRSAWGAATGRPSPQAAAQLALANCERQRGTLPEPCRLFAQDGRILSGTLPAVQPVGAAIGPFRASPFHLRRGPQVARGVLVWSHGYGGNDRDYRNAPTPALAGILNDAGWDVLRFDRDPADDMLYTSQPRLVAGLPVLRGLGYRRIVLGGQSRGGWQALMAGAERPEGVEAVIATAPAAHGEAERPNTLGAALEDFRRLVASLPAEGPRALIALFDNDPFESEVDRRAALVAEAAERRSAPLLALWPREGISGHAGAYDWRFTRFFGGCILSLVQAPAAGAPRGLRRDPCGGG